MPIKFNSWSWKVIEFLCKLWFLPPTILQNIGKEKKLLHIPSSFAPWFLQRCVLLKLVVVYSYCFWHLYTCFWVSKCTKWCPGGSEEFGVSSQVCDLILGTWAVSIIWSNIVLKIVLFIFFPQTRHLCRFCFSCEREQATWRFRIKTR